MFQSIRQGQQFFILHKGENPRCDVGTVVSVSNPVPKYQNGYTAYPLPQNEMVVDVKVKVGDDTLDFQKLPANLSIADFSQVGGNVVVSESKDAINAEIEAMKISSVRVVESVEYHQKVIKSCDEMLTALNPAFAEKAQQDKEMKELKGELSQIKDILAQLAASGIKLPDVQHVNNNNNNNNKKINTMGWKVYGMGRSFEGEELVGKLSSGRMNINMPLPFHPLRVTRCPLLRDSSACPNVPVSYPSNSHSIAPCP